MTEPEPAADDRTVVERIAAVMDEVGAIPKSQRSDQGYMFRGIDQVLTALHDPMARHGVVVVPQAVERELEKRTTARGGTLHVVHLHVRYRFHGPGGDYIDASGWGEASDSGDKATQKAMSQALKSVMFQVFLIPTEDTIEPDVAAVEPTTAWTDEQLARATTAAGLVRDAADAQALQAIGSKAHSAGLIDAPVEVDGVATTLRQVLDHHRAQLQRDAEAAAAAARGDDGSPGAAGEQS